MAGSPRYTRHQRGSGEIGRHAGFRFLCLRVCGFKSHLPHDVNGELYSENNTRDPAITAMPAISP